MTYPARHLDVPEAALHAAPAVGSGTGLSLLAGASGPGRVLLLHPQPRPAR